MQTALGNPIGYFNIFRKRLQWCGKYTMRQAMHGDQKNFDLQTVCRPSLLH